MKKVFLFLFVVIATQMGINAQHSSPKGKILIVAANPSVSENTGWPIGCWASELTHPYWEFVNAGYEVEIVSPSGGKLEFDTYSNPEDASGYSASDLISMGWLHSKTHMEKIANTRKLADVNMDDYKAIFLVGGQSPMYTFKGNKALADFVVKYYQTGKPTALVCHSTCVLLDAKLPNGKYLVEGKKWTGFANSEEMYADAYVGKRIQPFWIQDEANKMANTTFVVKPAFTPYAIADGTLITGQQQNSGAEAAKLVIAELEKQRKNYPTYVLVHGAWADESAWGFIKEQLAVNANVEIVNLPAHGLDNTPANKVTLDSYVKTVTDVINRQSGKVILVGHSMAGIVISQVAENMPEKIEKLVYVSAYLPKNGEDLLSLSKQDTQSKVGNALSFTEDYSAATINKDMIAPAVCADCPDYMKEILVKYHKAEPAAPLSEKVKLSDAKFGKVPKYYIHSSNDFAVGYELQKAMVKNNGTIKQTYTMATSHLPFVVQPAEFIKILTSIK